MEDIFEEYLHTGIPLKKWFWNKPEDIAASAQLHLEHELKKYLQKLVSMETKLHMLVELHSTVLQTQN